MTGHLPAALLVLLAARAYATSLQLAFAADGAYELTFDGAPWAVSDAPPAFIKGQLRGILGLEIEITDMRGKWKMSQNRPLPDMAGVAHGLADPSDPHHDPAAAALVAELLAARGEP